MKDGAKVESSYPRFTPPTTDEERAMQMSAMALDSIEERIREKKASPSELLYCAKLGSEEARLDRQIQRENVKLLQARTEDIQRSKNTEELYRQAIKAFQSYNGIDLEEEEDGEEDGF